MRFTLILIALLAFLAQDAPATKPQVPPTLGLIALPQDALAYVGTSVRPGEPAPLLLLLHGAGRGPDEMIARFRAAANVRGLILVAPKSRDPTWDIMSFARRETGSGRVGEGQAVRYDGSPDGDRIDAALAAFTALAHQPLSKLIVAGFSDGASFALAAGTDRRRHADAVLAFSPGVQIASLRTTRRIAVHIAHGRQDEVLTFDFTKGVIIPALERAGVRATLHPFEGRHSIPEPVLTEMLDAVLPKP